ncbi:MAG TPA: urea ABC transporter permease subunit UrtC, partial [Pseudomonadales bacterium]|nr:urea ABC transporter permease subunit UrtC [Pseudomonadales bacterium]
MKLLTLQSRLAWFCLAGLAALFLILIPLLRVVTPDDSFLHMPDYLVVLIGKFFCYAIVAIAIDLIWGFTGILSLGHGVFFALGGYCMGMYLMRASAGMGVYKSDLPDFMVFLDWKEYPWFWYGFQYFGYAMLMVVLIPSALAYLFGFFAFRSRIKGVYFSIITQAMTFAFVLLFFRNETGFGGNNGLTDFKNLLGFELKNPATKLTLYCISGGFLIAAFLFARFIVQSKFGRVLMAIRDAESRLRFSGYDTLQYKLWIWTASAAMCGIAGALYVPQVGIINPSEMQPANSIEMAIWVA